MEGSTVNVISIGLGTSIPSVLGSQALCVHPGAMKVALTNSNAQTPADAPVPQDQARPLKNIPGNFSLGDRDLRKLEFRASFLTISDRVILSYWCS